MSKAKFITAVLIICISVVVVVVLNSCAGTKEVVKTVSIVDSSYAKKYDSVTKRFSEMRASYQRQLNEAKKSQVKFEKVPCPPSIINIDSLCQFDSLVKIIVQQENYIKSLKNKVTVLADGSVQYEGQIKSAKAETQRAEQSRNYIEQRFYDSTRVSDSLRRELSKKDSLSSKEIKRGFPWYGWIAMFICFMGGLYLGVKYSSQKKTVMKKLLFFLIACVALMSCGHFHDEPTKSVWAGGLWVLPWLTAIGSVIFFVLAYLSSKSNSTTQRNTGSAGAYVEDNTGNVPIYKLGFFWFGVILAVATIIIIIWVNAEK